MWDGVKNAQALIHLRAMREGDPVLVYHSGDEKALMGLARVARGPYADPKLDDPKLVVVELAAERTLARPVTLAAIKASGKFAELALVRQGRLSVMPVSSGDWKALMKLAGERHLAVATTSLCSRRVTHRYFVTPRPDTIFANHVPPCEAVHSFGVWPMASPQLPLPFSQRKIRLSFGVKLLLTS